MNPGDRKSTPQPIPVEPRVGAGPWGLFRLLDQAAEVTDEGSQATVTWLMPAGPSVLHVSWTMRGPSAHHPFKRGFLRVTPPGTP